MEHDTFLNWLPAEVQGLFDRVGQRWQHDDEPQSQGAVALVGLPGAGKKTLYNSLCGWQAVGDSGEMIRNFGLFTLINLHSDRYDSASIIYRLENARLIVYVMDAEAGLQADDYEWIAKLRALGGTLIVALNKLEALPEAERSLMTVSVQERVARPVLPVSALDVEAVHRQFLPAVLKLCPEVAEPLAGEIASLRRRVAHHLILRCAAASATTVIDSSADIPTLASLQMRMARRIAAVYGQHAPGNYDSLVMFGLRHLFRLSERLSARFPRLRTWLVAGTLAAGSTFVLGQMAMLVYGTELPGRALKRFFTVARWRVGRLDGQRRT